MGFFSRFERRVEDGFEGINEKLFDAPISPVQIEKKAEKQMRREKMVGAGKEFAPTLYTILVNPDDDQRLFGYYPTLAGETETYLRAKAMDQGLVMDGAPLVRFIVDDDLKPGKFDVIAELVSAPIIKQLRAEEMARYGIGGAYPHQHANNEAAYQEPTPYSAPAQQNAYASEKNDSFATPMPIEEGFENAAGGAGADFAGAGIGAAAGAGVAGASEAAMAGAASAAAGMAGVQADLYARPGQRGQSDYSSSGIDVMAEDPAQFDNYNTYSQAAVAEPIAVGQTMHFGGNSPQQGQTTHHGEPHLVNLTTGRTFTLAPARVLIGRAVNCDIVLNDLNVSRTHAEIRRESTAAWSVADLGSTNGTLVNGRHIAEVMLNEGDRITTGTTTFLFTFR